MRYVQVGEVLDPQPYLDALPGLKDQLPPGAHRFAADPDHYDFWGRRCVHDLELGRITLADEPGGPVEVELVANPWKHDADLILRYSGFRSSSITNDGRALGHRALGDLMLDELVPADGGGVRHTMAFETGTVEIVADDVTHEWVQTEGP